MRQLLHTQRQLQLALAAGRVGTWQVDLKTFQLTGSREHSAILGVDSRVHDVNEVAQRLVHPDDRDAINAAWLAAAFGAVPFSAEYRIIRPDGMMRWLEVRGETECDPTTGEPSLFLGVMVDVTERKEREQQFRTMTELAPQFVWLADADGRMTYANSTVLSYLSAEQEAFLGDGWLAFVHPDDRPRTEREWLSSIGSGMPFETEFRVRSGAGTNGWFLSRATPLREKSEGKIERWLGVSIDISVRKDAEDALRSSVDHLVRERDLRERFVATLTHDLRTPLSTATMSVALLGNGKTTAAEQPKLIERLTRSLDRMDQMINGLLDASKLNAGHDLPIFCKRMDMTALVSETLNELRQLHGDRFVLEAPGPLFGVWDGNAVRRMVENLAQNAIKYGSASGPITIKLEEHTTGVALRVHNVGDTIALADQSKLFLPFQRSPSAGAERGWGLGLAVVKGLVEAHRGDVRVTSTDADGTSFTVFLPVDSTQASAV